jgi:hypothetical protein
MPNRAQRIYKPEFRFGLGGVSLGNEFNKHTDKEAEGTLEAAWELGVRYFDVAPWYGFGLAERRFGHFLHNKKREDYLLSSKVGKLFKASKNNRHAEIYPLSDSPNDIVFDYTADGVRRSIEDSLQRLGVDSLDVAFVHDISPDFSPPSARRMFRSSSGPRSMQALYREARATTTARTISRSPRPRSKSAKNSERWRRATASICVRPRFSSRRRRMSRSPLSSGREAISRSPRTTIRCKQKSRPNSGPSLNSKL